MTQVESMMYEATLWSGLILDFSPFKYNPHPRRVDFTL